MDHLIALWLVSFPFLNPVSEPCVMGPLFTFSDGHPLTRQKLSSTVQSILSAAGYSGVYSGHSFRISTATTAAAQGVPDHLIKTLGRWSSDAYQIYIRTLIHSTYLISWRPSRYFVFVIGLGASGFGPWGL